MSINLIVTGPVGNIEVTLTFSELDALYTRSNEEIKSHLDVIFGAGDRGDRGDRQDSGLRKVRAGSLATAIEDLIRWLERSDNRSQERFCSYTIKASPVPGMKSPIRCSNLGGIYIGGELFTIDSGVGYCDLHRWEASGDGKLSIVETRDLRDSRELKTDNMGVIEIEYRSELGQALKPLAKLGKFIGQLDPTEEATVRIQEM